MNEKLLTIFSPVYNRADKIQNLYQSLVAQTNRNFVWMIVNDGSKDDIDIVINSFIKEKKINIQYYKQINQGKHVAHNFGVAHCETSFFTCVDSDDILLSNAVEEIVDFINKNITALTNIGISGIVAYRGYTATEKIGLYPSSLEAASLSELYLNKGMTGDTFLIFKTSVIRSYPFPVFKGENFLRESIAYDLIDIKYRYLLLAKILYISEYCADGLTKNASKLELKAPLGAALFRYHEAKKTKDLKHKIRNFAAYVFFSRLAHNEKECRKKLRFKYPFYWLLSFSGFIKYRKLFKE